MNSVRVAAWRLGEVNFKKDGKPDLSGAALRRVELLDVDGITAASNFKPAWTTGWIAGRAMATGTWNFFKSKA